MKKNILLAISFISTFAVMVLGYILYGASGASHEKTIVEQEKELVSCRRIVQGYRDTSHVSHLIYNNPSQEPIFLDPCMFNHIRCPYDYSHLSEIGKKK